MSEQIVPDVKSFSFGSCEVHLTTREDNINMYVEQRNYCYKQKLNFANGTQINF